MVGGHDGGNSRHPAMLEFPTRLHQRSPTTQRHVPVSSWRRTVGAAALKRFGSLAVHRSTGSVRWVSASITRSPVLAVGSLAAAVMMISLASIRGPRVPRGDRRPPRSGA